MAGVVFYGSGIVLIPGTGKFVRFNNGEYATVDPLEISLLAKKYKHNTQVIDLYEEPKEIEDKPKRGRKPKNADRDN